MTVYKNKNTGEVREFACTLTSDVWESCENKTPIANKEKTEKPVRKTTKK